MKTRNVLVTGAFGNVGWHLIRELLTRGHRVLAFDAPTRRNQSRAKDFQGEIEVLWGDIRDPQHLDRAVSQQDAVFHLAWVLPPLSETQPELSEAVNVEGSRQLIRAAEGARAKPRLVFASSYAVHGDTRDLDELLTPDSPVAPASRYSVQKLQVEELVQASDLDWCILRLGAVLSARVALDGAITPLIFDLPADAKQEFIHSDDAAKALASCLETRVWGRSFMIGGGPSCQLRYIDLVNRQLGALGIEALPSEAFSEVERQGGGWMDTRESHAMLDYQRWTFEEHLADLSARAGLLRTTLARAFAPAVRWYLLRQSPYLAPGR